MAAWCNVGQQCRWQAEACTEDPSGAKLLYLLVILCVEDVVKEKTKIKKGKKKAKLDKTAVVCECEYIMLWIINSLIKWLWLSGLIRFLSHSACWALLADDLQWTGFKSMSGHEFSVGWTNGRYAMRLISRTGTEGPPVSSLNCDRCRL